MIPFQFAFKRGRGASAFTAALLVAVLLAPGALARWPPWSGEETPPAIEWSIPKAMIHRLEIQGIDPGPVVSVGSEGRDPKADSLAQARSHYLLGQWLMARDEPGAAQKALETALKDDPGSILTKVALAGALLAQGRGDECVKNCEKALEADPKCVEARLLMGQAHEKAKQIDKAIESYRKGLEVLPESLSLLEPLGNLYLQQANVKGVIEIFERIHERQRKSQRRNLYVMMVLARFYEFNGQADEAMEMYREAMRVYPGHTDIYVSLANLLLRIGERDEAFDVCKKGLIRNPEEDRLLAIFERCAGSAKACAQEYRRFADEYSQLTEIQLMWAKRATARLRDFDGAEEGFRRVLEFEPNHREALLGLAAIMQMKSRASEAIEFYRRAIAAYPDEAEAYKGMAVVYAQKGQWADAADQYEAAIKFSPDDIESYLKLSILREEAGQADKALQVIQKGLEHFDDKGQKSVLMERQGELLMAGGKPGEAAQAFRRALAARGGDLALYERLMNACLGAGDRGAMEELVAQGRKVFEKRLFEFEALLAGVYHRNRMEDASIDSLKRAVSLNGDLFPLREQLVAQLTAQKRYKEAQEALTNAEEKFGDKEKWKLALSWADLYTEQKRFDDALRALEPRTKEILDEQTGKTVGLEDKLTVLNGYALVLDKAGRRDEALGVVDSLLKDAAAAGGSAGKQERKEFVLRVCAYLSFDLKAWDKALGLYKQLVALSPDNDEYFYRLGGVYNELKDNKEAEKNLRHALELNPSNYNALNHLGFMFAEESRNLDEAITLINRAAQIRPKAGYIIDSLGWAYFKKGDVDKAVKYLEEAASLPPVDAEIYDHLGDAQEKKGALQKAIDSWNEALKLDATRPGLREKIERARKTAGKQGQL